MSVLQARLRPILTGMPDLRLQLLEPERHPYLYKCLYGLLMLLPQSSAFAALKNRLQSVSAIALLHGGTLRYVPLHHSRQRSNEITLAHPLGGLTSSSSVNVASGAGTPTASTYGERAPGRLGTKAREGDGGIKWGEMLEKFRNTQDRSRKMQQRQQSGQGFGENERASRSMLDLAGSLGDSSGGAREKALPDVPRSGGGDGSRPASAQGGNLSRMPPSQAPGHKSRSSLGNFGRLTGGIGSRNKAKR